MPSNDLLRDLDRYFDAAPRSDADALDADPFTLFVGRGEWSYYARPQHGLISPVSASDVAALEALCVEHDVKLAIEWIGEITPSLELASRAAGLAVEHHVRLVLAPADLKSVELPVGYSTELLVGDDPRLADARAVGEVAFGASGTSIGSEGAAERDKRLEGLSEDRGARPLLHRPQPAQRSRRRDRGRIGGPAPQGRKLVAPPPQQLSSGGMIGLGVSGAATSCP